jgi:PLP dependent protein
VREEIGRDDVEVLAAVKYVALEDLGVLAEAGLTIVGENRAQELERKARAFPDLTWDFIGHLQSRKVKQVLPYARLVHSVATDSVLDQLAKHATPATEVLVEVNVAREPGKSGVDPDELDAFLERCPCRVGGLMTMPPATDDPEASRPWFAELARLARDRGLPRLSMGTSQDYVVAAEEGATIVRIGTKLYS